MDQKDDIEQTEQGPGCCCSDPYETLPHELRPKPVPKKGALRNVECPQCGMSYWSNRASDICMTCEKSM